MKMKQLDLKHTRLERASHILSSAMQSWENVGLSYGRSFQHWYIKVYL